MDECWGDGWFFDLTLKRVLGGKFQVFQKFRKLSKIVKKKNLSKIQKLSKKSETVKEKFRNGQKIKK